jgi:hypothetical protein
MRLSILTCLSIILKDVCSDIFNLDFCKKLYGNLTDSALIVFH